MASEWQYHSLSELCVYINRGLAPAYIDKGGILVLNQRCVRDHRIIFEEARRTDPLRKPIGQDRMLRPFDILINSTGVGTLGRVAQITILPEPTTVDSHITIVRPNPERVEPRFLGLTLRAHQEIIETLAEGSTGQTELPRSRLASLRVPVPPMSEQRAIAHILGTLDDKIELNRRMNETLEAIARAIFKSWFVDFDPVIDNALKAGKPIPDELKEKAARRREVLQRAQAERRPAGLPEHLARLFPDEFVESELGWVPKGWSIGSLGNLCEVAIGGDWGEDTPFPNAVEAVCLRGVDLENLRQYGYADAPRRWVKKSSIIQRSLDERDVLIAASGVGPVGYSLWVTSELLNIFGLPLIYSNFCKRLRCVSAFTAVYLDRLLYIMRETGEVWEYVNGTSVPNLNIKGLLNNKVILLPPQRILEYFYKFLRPILSRLYLTESRTLINIRDALLPRLVSGEIRVKPKIGDSP